MNLLNTNKFRWLSVVSTFLLIGSAAAQVDDPFGTRPPSDTPSPKQQKAKEADTEPDLQVVPRVPVDPRLVRLYLNDGTEIQGKLSITEIEVKTSFGPLVIPITKIRKFTPGLESHSELLKRIRQSIADLGADSQQQRDAAQQALIDLGLPVRKELELHRDDEDAERSRRIKAILAKLAAEAEELDDEEFDSSQNWIRQDVVETTAFTALGRISPAAFNLTSRYGKITVPINDIKLVRTANNSYREDELKSLSVDGTNLAQLKFKSSGIRVEPGDKITVRADGRINRSSSSSYVSTPDGSSRFGQYVPNIAGGALVARVGSGGQVIKVGSKSTFTCKRAGALQFAIGMRPDYVGRYQFLGKYDLKVKVVRSND